MPWTKHWLYFFLLESKFKIKLYEPLWTYGAVWTTAIHCKLLSKQEVIVQTQLVLQENAKYLKNIFPSHPNFLHYHVPLEAP